MMKKNKPMKIDVDAVLRDRLRHFYPVIPSGLISWLKDFICQDTLNLLLDHNGEHTGGEFCKGVLEDLHVTADFHGEENLPDDSRFTIACNHPLGGLDGMVLIDYFTRRYPSKKVKFVVNDLLTAVEPLNDVFLPVNKHGKQSRERIRNIDDAFASDAPIIVFPAGLVSRKRKNGEIADLEWHRMFVKKSLEHHRCVIPTFFSGENSSFFYNFARLRNLSGLKFNLEMIRLPREVIESRGKKFNVYFGQPVSWQSLADAPSDETALKIRNMVYGLKPDHDAHND